MNQSRDNIFCVCGHSLANHSMLDCHCNVCNCKKYKEKKEIYLSNRSEIANRKIVADLGIISGSIAPSRFIVRDIIAHIRNLLGREVKEYTEMLDTARKTALNRLQESAKELGADAVVNVRFMGSSASQNSTEILCYGTAVKLD